MVTINVATSDHTIWNVERFLISLCSAMAANQDITIDLNQEGPDISAVGIYQLIVDAADTFQFDLKKIKLRTANFTQANLPFDIEFVAPTHFVSNTRKQLRFIKKDLKKTFGMFIGRSNTPRLYLSSYLWNHYQDQTVQTFHYTTQHNFHKDNLGLDQLIDQNGTDSVVEIAKFLQHTPMHLQQGISYPILMDKHCDLAEFYQDFFVEIVCETYYSGQTFFPTEKTWRAIATGTPFIVQGPQYYLNRLHEMGFQTFSNYWNEMYTEDPADYQPYEIIKIIDQLGAMSLSELQAMYQDMLPILEHNHNRFYSLIEEEFKIAK